jgi:patatin-like phospholipase/acyl hydrolase
MANCIKVLSIDGGGIRGIIPAMILSEIERRAQRPISELFHLTAGTSTGGILALGLTKPDGQGKPEYTAEKLIMFYEAEGKRIFSSPLKHRIRTAWSLSEEKYSSEGIEGVSYEYFGEARLKDALADVLIASYEIERRSPFFFKSRDAKIKEGWDFSMRQWRVRLLRLPLILSLSRLKRKTQQTTMR